MYRGITSMVTVAAAYPSFGCSNVVLGDGSSWKSDHRMRKAAAAQLLMVRGVHGYRGTRFMDGRSGYEPRLASPRRVIVEDQPSIKL